MTGLRSALLEWDADRVARALVAGSAVYLSMRFTNGFLIGLGVVVLCAVVLDIPLAVVERTLDRSRDE